MESQKKTTGTKDNIDENDAGHDSDNPFTYTIAGRSNRSVDGITYGNSRNHADADKAADDYIYNNIINLGETIHADKYSHYAMKGKKRSGTGDEQTEDVATEIFYRVGLYETVPLYFLPVITNRNQETVRAGSVVVVVPGTTTTTIIPGNGGTPSTNSLFNDLFVVNSNLTASRGVISNPDYNALASGLSKIVTTFDGDMIFTGVDWDYSSDYTLQDNHEGLYLYTNEEKEYQAANGLSILQMNAIANVGNRLVQDTSIAIDTYVSGFLKKLSRPHIELEVQNYEFNTNNLTSITNQYVRDFYAVETAKGTIYYRNTSDGNYYSCLNTYLNKSGNEYYLLNREETGINNAATGWQYLAVKGYVYDNNKNKLLVHKDNNNNLRFFKREVINWNTVDTEITPSILSSDSNLIKYSYSDNGTNVEFSIDVLNIDFSQNSKVSEQDVKNSSVYHWMGGSGMNATLKIDGGLNGDETDPIYIIVTEGNPKIEVSVSNERPVIYCYLGSSSEIVMNIGANVTFKGTIYAPYKGVMIKNQSSATFEGNVIADYINIQEAGASYTQKNFVANDKDLTVASDAIAAAEAARKQQATTFAQQQLASLGITSETWNDASWFASQSAEKQQQIAAAWYNARKQLWEQFGIDMPDWPWSTGGKTTDTDHHHYSTSTNTGGSTGGQTIITTTDETLRLINFRTEYQPKDDGSEHIVDPFTLVSLRKPNSY